MQKFLILWVSLFALLAEGKIHSQSLLGTAVKVGHPLLAPALGWTLRQTGVIDNIRFMGNGTPGYKGRDRDYTADTSTDPLWQIVFLLFPSNTGTLGAHFNAATNLAYQIQHLGSPQKQTQVVAGLLKYVTDKRTEITETKVVPKKSDFITSLGIDPKSPLAIVLRRLMKSVDGYLYTEAKSTNPEGLPEQLILSFFVEIFNTQEDVDALISELNRLMPPSPKAHPVTQLMDEVFAYLVHNQLHSLIPYEPGARLIQNGEVWGPDDKPAADPWDSIPDCGSTVLRHLFNLALYHPKTGRLEVPLHIPHYAELKEFVDLETKDGVQQGTNNGDSLIRTKWHRLLVKWIDEMPHNPFGKIKYVGHDGDVLETGLLNLAGVLEAAVHVPFPHGPLPDSSTSNTAATAWFVQFFKNFIEILNPDLNKHLKITVNPLKWCGNEFEGHTAFTLLDDEGHPRFTFDLKAKITHGVMMLTNLEPHDATTLTSLATQERILYNAPPLPLDLLAKNWTPASLLLRLNGWTKKTPTFYSFLEFALQDDTAAQTDFMEKCAFEESLSKTFVPFLKNVITHFEWGKNWESINQKLPMTRWSAAFAKLMYETVSQFTFTPETFDSLPLFQSLESIEIHYIAKKQNRLTLAKMPKLKNLYIDDRYIIEVNLEDVDGPLQNIKIKSDSIQTLILPKNHSQLATLDVLSGSLREIRNLTSSHNLKTFHFSTTSRNFKEAPKMKELNLTGCNNLIDLNLDILSLTRLDGLNTLTSLKTITFCDLQIPSLTLTKSAALETVRLTHMPFLTTLVLAPSMAHLKTFDLTDLPQLRELPPLHGLNELESLVLSDLPLMAQIPLTGPCLNLKKLWMSEMPHLQMLPTLGASFPHLNAVNIQELSLVTTLPYLIHIPPAATVQLYDLPALTDKAAVLQLCQQNNWDCTLP